jgi:hypothetical protein
VIYRRNKLRQLGADSTLSGDHLHGRAASTQLQLSHPAGQRARPQGRQPGRDQHAAPDDPRRRQHLQLWQPLVRQNDPGSIAIHTAMPKTVSLTVFFCIVGVEQRRGVGSVLRALAGRGGGRCPADGATAGAGRGTSKPRFNASASAETSSVAAQRPSAPLHPQRGKQCQQVGSEQYQKIWAYTLKKYTIIFLLFSDIFFREIIAMFHHSS